MATRPNITTNFANINLDSASATRTPTFNFPAAAHQQGPITILRTANAAETCFVIKHWLLETFSAAEYTAPGIVRMESQDLHIIQPLHESSGAAREGYLLLAEDVARLDTRCISETTENRDIPVTMLGVVIPHHAVVRWYYTVAPIAPLLRRLRERELLHDNTRSIRPGSRLHSRLTTWLAAEFVYATNIPDSPRYLEAAKLIDYCPSIIHPGTALDRLLRNGTLYNAIRNPLTETKDLSDDRYRHHLHKAEQEAASVAWLDCSAYLLLKGRYFKKFYEEVRSFGGVIDWDASSWESTCVPLREMNVEDVRLQVSDEEEDEEEDEMLFDVERLALDRIAAVDTPMRPSATPRPDPASSIGRAQIQCSAPGVPQPGTIITPAPTGTPAPASSPAPTPTPTTRRRARAKALKDPKDPATSRRNRRSSQEGKRVRTETSHKGHLERNYGLSGAHARLLVVAWRELGFLDEGRVWGVFEDEVEDEDEQTEAGEEEKTNSAEIAVPDHNDIKVTKDAAKEVELVVNGDTWEAGSADIDGESVTDNGD